MLIQQVQEAANEGAVEPVVDRKYYQNTTESSDT